MKTTINILCVIAIAALLAFPHIDIELPLEKSSPIADAFGEALADYLVEVAESDEGFVNKSKALQAAFEESAKHAYEAGLSPEVDKLPEGDETTDALDALLLKTAEGLR